MDPNPETKVVLAPGKGNPPKKQAKPEESPEVKEAIEKRKKLDTLLQSRFFYTAAYEIYGGVKGLYDYGPPGSALNANLLALWREWFILEESMQQIQTASLTPEIVFQTSGHCAKFEDKMVRDTVTGDCHRADHLLEDVIDELLKNPALTEEEKHALKNDQARADDFSCEELAQKLKQYDAKSPDTGNPITEPFPFNLMFSTQIGPTGKFKGYLRPETAQGMFVNFARLLEYNGGKLPFAAAQIGPAYRNEIAPRSGLLRVREFTLAEIEHFVNPANKDHEKFHLIQDVVLPLYGREQQMSTDKQPVFVSCAKAVKTGVINNQSLCYFMARTYLFLLRIGVHKDKIRFRQHLANEMAHYAVGCWDAELHTTYGWIECAGHADRAAYDLSVHAKASKQSLSAFVLFADGPREVELLVAEPNKGLLGKQYKTEAKVFFQHIESIKDDQEQLRELKQQIEAGPVDLCGITLTSETLKFKTVKKNVTGTNILPGVIEPSFGIGRIIYCLLEHAFWARPDAPGTKPADAGKRVVLSLKPIIAPVCCSILPLLNKDDLLEQTKVVDTLLKKHRITTKVDSTAIAVGRRYARTDEIGIPFGITVDYEGLKDAENKPFPVEQQSVTLRERDSTEQIRVLLSELPAVIQALTYETTTWDEVKQKYPIVQRPDKDD